MQAKNEPSQAGLATILILALGTFATGTDAFIVAGVLPAVAGSLQSSLTAAGQIVTVFALAYAIGSPLVMTVTSNWPRRPVLVWGMVLFAAANVLSAFSPNLAVLTVSRIVAALLAGLFVPSATATASTIVAPEKRGRALAIVLGGTSASTVLGVPIGLFVSQMTNWRGAFLFVSALSVLAAIGIAVLMPQVPAPPRVSLADRAAVLKRGDVLTALLITVAANAGAFSVYTYLAPVFSDLGGTGLLQVLIFTFGLFAIVGSYLSGHGADKWGAVKVLTLALTIFTVNHFLLSVWAATIATAVVYMVLWGLTGWATIPPQQHRLVRMTGPASSIAISLNASALYLGIGLGGLLGGWVVDAYGADHLWIVSGAGGLLALVLLPVSVAVERRSAAARARKSAEPQPVAL
ncbi:MFS transporter [Streptomyces gamaensis]|uniref:MFS transporter n=1 Tax=Streptomyces gamaensis TaxID=1763542 RepID=A0ABW0YSZ4_9ACTN